MSTQKPVAWRVKTSSSEFDSYASVAPTREEALQEAREYVEVNGPASAEVELGDEVGMFDGEPAELYDVGSLLEHLSNKAFDGCVYLLGEDGFYLSTRETTDAQNDLNRLLTEWARKHLGKQAWTINVTEKVKL